MELKVQKRRTQIIFLEWFFGENRILCFWGQKTIKIFNVKISRDKVDIIENIKMPIMKDHIWDIKLLSEGGLKIGRKNLVKEINETNYLF